MRFLVDESTGLVVANCLGDQHHEVFPIFDDAKGIDNDSIIQKAFNENRILITNDKDFGEKVYEMQYPRKGIILLRFDNERSANKIAVIRRLFGNYSDNIADNFVVLTEKRFRFDKRK